MAAEDASEGQPATMPGAKAFDCLNCIARTSWLKATSWPEEGRNKVAIGPNEIDKQTLHRVPQIEMTYSNP